MSSALDSVNNILLAGGAPSFKFDRIGDIVKGTIVAASEQQQTNFKTGELEFYKDGKPKMQIVVTLQTDLRDSTIDDDDGQRRIFIKGQMLGAVGDALRKAKAKLDIGGTLAVKFDHEEEPPERGLSPKKCFVAAYQAPAVSAGANDLLGASSQAPGPFDAAPAQQQPTVAAADLLG